MHRFGIYNLLILTLFLALFNVITNANPYARHRSRPQYVYEPVLIVQPVLVPIDDRRHPNYRERVLESESPVVSKRTEIAYRTLDEYQKKGRPGQPLRFGKRALSPYLLRRSQEVLYDY